MKVALALSAGGMFGAYQAGVWQALVDVFEPDIVIGASVGALNGWMIAGGCPPEAMIEQWLGLENMKGIHWRIPKSLSDGLVESSLLEQWIQNMCGLRHPTLPFGVVMTELPTLQPRLFRWPDIDWRHLAGSCAVPGILKHYRIDGRLYTDGGFIDPSPVWAAIEAGADLIVSVNVLRRRPALIRALVRAARKRSGYRPPDTTGKVIIDIDPAAPLGAAKDSMYWTRANAERWIELGRKNGLASKHFLVECLERKRPAA